jgi:hypothetical protein
MTLIPRCHICDKGIKDEFYLALYELAPVVATAGELAGHFGFAHYQCVGADGRLAYLRKKGAPEDPYPDDLPHLRKIRKRSIKKAGSVKTKQS